MEAVWWTRRGLAATAALGSKGASVSRALLAIGGAACALILSACQTPMATGVLRERAELPAAAAVEPAPPAPAPAAREVTPEIALESPLRALPRQKLSERLAELLVDHAPDLSPIDRARVASVIQSAQEAHQLDPLLVLAIIEQESQFDPKARGHGGSIGLMQVKPFVARDIAQRHGIPWKGPKTLLDPAANVSIGACYLGEMFEMYGDPGLAIIAYNLGPYRVQRMVANGRNTQTQYLLSVLARYQALSSQFGPVDPEEVEDANAD
jgi:soluble lytic murein transglycosylase-like protein